MLRIEIVTHCYSGPSAQYAKLLNYQLSSLVIHPPRNAFVTLSVCWADESPLYCDLPTPKKTVLAGFTGEAGAANGLPTNIVIRSVPMPRGEMFQRPIGRHRLAKATEANAVWFADCDYVFGPGGLDTLAGADLGRRPLFFPQRTLICRDHARGGTYIDAVRDLDSLHE